MNKFYGYLLTLSTFISMNLGLFSNEYSEKEVSASNNLNRSEIGLINGAELLYMTTSFSPLFSTESLVTEFLRVSDIGTSTIVFENDQRSVGLKFVEPKYDIGFSLFTKYTTPVSNNKIGGYYTYIRNNASGSLNKKFDAPVDFISTGGSGNPRIQRNSQSDRAHQHLHIHIADLLMETSFSLTPYMILDLLGGFTGFDFHYYLNLSENDDLLDFFTSNNNAFFVNNIQLKAWKKSKAWGIGPKIATNFNYKFFPLNWDCQLNFNLLTQFALLFSKSWERGKSSLFYYHNPVSSSNPSSIIIRGRNWNDSADFRFIPNINLDFNLNLEITKFKSCRLNLALGYKIFTFWEFFDPKNTSKFTSINQNLVDSGFPGLGIFDQENEDISFSGGFLRLSVAY